MISPRCKWVWAALCVIVMPIAPAAAATLENLYETALPIGSSQDAAFVEALKTVVIRVSGQRDAPARLGSTLASPRQYVQRFGVTQDNVLQVGFDNVSVDRMLTEAGLPIWGHERPATMIALNLEEAGANWASLDISSADKERIARVARERGLPLIWGTLDAQDDSLLASGGDDSGLLAIATRNDANAILLGRGRRDAIQWTLVGADSTDAASGTLEDGVHLAADAFAKLFAAAGTSLNEIIIDIAGIANLDAYASTLNYLEGMTLVRSVAVRSVAGDTMQFKLAVRGDASTLKRAIALDSRLMPVQGGTGDPADSDQRLAFRYQP